MRRRRPGFWYGFAISLVRPSMRVLTRRRWSGEEHVPPEGTGVIVAANHLSQLDPFTVAHFLYVRCHRLPRFLAKSPLFSMFFVGTVLRGAGQIPVFRGTEDASRALEAAVEALRQGRCVLIYPEGTITRREDYWPSAAKTGVARLALLSGAPVVPVAHWGTQRILEGGRLHLRRTEVSVRAGAPVDLAEFRDRPLDPVTLRDATSRIMGALDDLLADLRGEPVPPDLERTA